MLKLRTGLPILVLTFITLLAGLTHTRTDARQRADNPEPFKVGVFVPLSGQFSDFGVSTLNGIKMAADEINARGGVGGRKITLVVKDDEGRPDLAATVVARMIANEKVHAVLGEVASSNTLAAASVAQREAIPMITPAATNPRVTQVGDYIFRACFTDPFQGEFLARFVANTLKARRAAILFDDNSDYSRGLVEAFTRTFGRLGGRVALTQKYAQTDEDFAAQLVAIRAARPDVIFVPGYYAQAGVIARQARRLGLGQPLIGVDGWDAPQLWQSGGRALDGSFMSNHYSTEDPRPANQKFIAEYRKRHGQLPDSLAALGYDAMGMLAEAFRGAGTTDGAKLRDAIARTKNYAGVTGTITLNAQRDAVKPGIVFKLQNGKFHYRETVMPDAGTGD